MSRTSADAFPRYTTFSGGELEEALRKLDPDGKYRNGGTIAALTGKGRTSLLKEHTCAVHYPDGTEGTCTYTRYGPAWHRFGFQHGREPQRISLPYQHTTERLENTAPAIAAKAAQLATVAFQQAILREQTDHFRRATKPAGASPQKNSGDDGKPQFSAKRAKEIGGKYALCQRVGTNYVPVSPLFDALDAANTAWKAQENREIAVACACRWTRRWERPYLNPLYGEFREETSPE